MHFHPSLTETVSLSRQPGHLLRGEPDYCHQALRGKVFRLSYRMRSDSGRDDRGMERRMA
jgi:hypothetical protein